MATRAKKIADLEFHDPTIQGGTINSATIGNFTPRPGSFTSGSFSNGLSVSSNGGVPLSVVRGNTNGGNCIEFGDSDGLIGSWGFSNNGIMCAISGNTGLMFDDTDNAIKPAQGNNTQRDNAIDLGAIGNINSADVARFKDLYLAGTAYIGTDLFCDEKGKIGNVDNTGGKSLMVGDTGSNSGYACLVSGMAHDITGDINVVGGYGNTVSGARNAVFGGTSTVSSDANFSAGDEHTIGTGGACNFVAGFEHEVPNGTFNATVLGYRNKALGNNSFTGGGYWTRPNQAGGVNSFAFGGGCRTEVDAVNSVALGALSTCGGGTETANQSMAIGYDTKAYADNSFSGGNTSIAFGNTSFAFGNGCNASKGFSNIALGRGITTPASASAANLPGAVAVGQWNEWSVTTDQHFAVGTGTADGARYTSFYVGPRSTANANIVMRALKDSSNYTNDTAAGLGGVPLGGLYRSSGYVKIRLT
jgi:hypothetical protein